jgi:hypothetical protein
MKVVKHEADDDKPAYKATLRSLIPDASNNKVKLIIASPKDDVLDEFPREKLFTLVLGTWHQKTLEGGEKT